MKWFIKKLRRNDFTQVLQDYKLMKCHKPANLKGKKIYLLEEKDVCEPGMLEIFVIVCVCCSVSTAP